jgi:hypothetical protein
LEIEDFCIGKMALQSSKIVNERGIAVDVRLTFPQEIEVRSVDNGDFIHNDGCVGKRVYLKEGI